VLQKKIAVCKYN